MRALRYFVIVSCTGVETCLTLLPVFIFFKFIALICIELILSYNYKVLLWLFFVL